MASPPTAMQTPPPESEIRNPKSAFHVWLLAIRPKTLFAAVVPVLVGTALAWTDGGFHAPSALAALLGAVLIQIGTNFSNDYVDFLKGADTHARKGPLRVTQAGLVTAETMKRATILTFALAFVVGLYLVWRGGWPILALGLASIALGALYTAGRYALAYTGLADLVVLIFFGPVAVGGTYYVQTLALTPEAVVAGLGPGLLSMALLVVNNLRDVDEDRVANKKTLIVRFGAGFGRGLYAAAIVGALLVPFVQTLGFGATSILAVIPVSLFGQARQAIRQAQRGSGRELLPVLGLTGSLLMQYGGFYVLAVVVTHVLDL